MKSILHTEINTITNPYFQVLYKWTSPTRYWVRQDRSWYILYTFFFVVIIAILALMGEYVFIIGVIAFVFLWFVQAAIPPDNVEHVITSLGVKTFGKLYRWQDIQCFWFSSKNNVLILNLDIYSEIKRESSFKKRISLLLNEDDDKQIFQLLIKDINYGDKDEVGYNIFAHAIYGKFIDISTYLPKATEEDEFRVEKKSKKMHSTLPKKPTKTSKTSKSKEK